MLFAYSLRYQGRSLIPKFRLDGLDPKAGYAVRELNVDKPRFWFDGKTLSGRTAHEWPASTPTCQRYTTAPYSS